MAETKTGKRGSGGKWVVLGGLVLAALVAVETGWAGWGAAHLRAAVFPRDESLLGWVPGDTAALVVVDPHQLHLDALGPEGSTPRTALLRTRDDIKQATGIDLSVDVDKLVLSNALVVARGRFDGKKLQERLADHRYVPQAHEGTTVLVRAGEDAIAVIDDAVLLYGDEAGVKAGLTAHAQGTSLEKNEATTARLRQIGWNHAALVSVRITDDKPSVRQMLSGSTGPRAVSVAVSTTLGVDVDARVEAASPGGAGELAKLLEEKRKAGGEATALVGQDAAAILADVAKKATITADDASVRIHAHLDPAQVDALVKNAKASAPLAELYKTVRLYQLLAPGG
jgi:hypothetical protein